MKVSEIAREWLDKADEDLAFASQSLGYNVNYFAQICFHLQQSAEKYLKAFIVAYELDFRPIHNLLELLEICRERQHEINKIEEECRYLNPFYIDTRYPVHWPIHYDKEIALKAKEAAYAIGEWVKAALEIKEIRKVKRVK